MSARLLFECKRPFMLDGQRIERGELVELQDLELIHGLINADKIEPGDPATAKALKPKPLPAAKAAVMRDRDGEQWKMKAVMQL
jgi:hypothetical protein